MDLHVVALIVKTNVYEPSSVTVTILRESKLLKHCNDQRVVYPFSKYISSLLAIDIVDMYEYSVYLYAATVNVIVSQSHGEVMKPAVLPMINCAGFSQLCYPPSRSCMPLKELTCM